MVVEIGDDADDAAGLVADADEFNDGVGPRQMPVDGILAQKKTLGETLTDDDHGFGAFAIAVAEIAALDDGHA